MYKVMRMKKWIHMAFVMASLCLWAGEDDSVTFEPVQPSDFKQAPPVEQRAPSAAPASKDVVLTLEEIQKRKEEDQRNKEIQLEEQRIMQMNRSARAGMNAVRR